MKWIIQILVILVLAAVLELFLPWWSVAIAGFIAGFFLRSDANFLAGFMGVGLLWLFYALVINIQATTPLAGKVAEILFLQNTLLIILVTGIVGGLVGGLATMTGSILRQSKRKYY